MTPLAMLPIVGVAAGALGRGLGSALSEGLSFADSLRSSAPQEGKPTGEAAPSAAELEQSFLDALERFRSHLTNRLAAAGVDLNGPLELQSDGLGGVQVAGDHPERALIEQTISGDFFLQCEFQALAGEYASLHPEFDPQHTDFGLLLMGDRAQVSLDE